MCYIARVGDIECSSVGEVAAALQIDPSLVSDDPPEFCLCNAHLERLGFRPSTADDGWFPDFIYVTTAESAITALERLARDGRGPFFSQAAVSTHAGHHSIGKTTEDFCAAIVALEKTTRTET